MSSGRTGRARWFRRWSSTSGRLPGGASSACGRSGRGAARGGSGRGSACGGSACGGSGRASCGRGLSGRAACGGSGCGRSGRFVPWWSPPGVVPPWWSGGRGSAVVVPPGGRSACRGFRPVVVPPVVVPPVVVPPVVPVVPVVDPPPVVVPPRVSQSTQKTLAFRRWSSERLPDEEPVVVPSGRVDDSRGAPVAVSVRWAPVARWCDVAARCRPDLDPPPATSEFVVAVEPVPDRGTYPRVARSHARACSRLSLTWIFTVPVVAVASTGRTAAV